VPPCSRITRPATSMRPSQDDKCCFKPSCRGKRSEPIPRKVLHQALVIRTSSLHRKRKSTRRWSSPFYSVVSCVGESCNHKMSVPGKEKSKENATRRGAKESELTPSTSSPDSSGPCPAKNSSSFSASKVERSSVVVSPPGAKASHEGEAREKGFQFGSVSYGWSARERERGGRSGISCGKERRRSARKKGRTHQGSPRSRTASTSSPTPSPTLHPHSPPPLPPPLLRQPTDSWR
jgi:hypothetical protein